MSLALEFRGVVKCYGRRHALDHLDLAVPEGAIMGLVGSNGAGKTTAMAVSTGLLYPSGGEIELLGQGPFRADLHAGRVALLPQDSRFPPHARVKDLLHFYGRLQGMAPSALKQSIETLLDWVHLTDRRDAPVRTLSHGMQRRLSIAQAFLGSPELILLDEPLNGLDPREAARIRDLIRSRHGHQTIVISSHILADVEILCDQVAFIEQGRLVRQDALDSIMRRRHRMTYVLTAPTTGLESLRAALPEVAWEVTPDGLTLTANFASPQTPEDLNAVALGILLGCQTRILEIKRGSDLETEYLKMHPVSGLDAPPPLPRNIHIADPAGRASHA